MRLKIKKVEKGEPLIKPLDVGLSYTNMEVPEDGIVLTLEKIRSLKKGEEMEFDPWL